MALKNALIAFMAPLPSIIFYIYFLNHHQTHHLLSPLWNWCYNHPLILANTLFFLNIDVGFWLISLLQSSNWGTRGGSLVIESITHKHQSSSAMSSTIFSSLTTFFRWGGHHSPPHPTISP
ncbi:hypothetical protein Hanom_Chr00s000130g01624941 [Helianthus anomalus]